MPISTKKRWDISWYMAVLREHIFRNHTKVSGRMTNILGSTLHIEYLLNAGFRAHCGVFDLFLLDSIVSSSLG